METITDNHTLSLSVKRLKQEGKKIAFVPTMGALHEGHLSLIRIAKARADVALASIFVNPTQFGPNEDFSRYPRTEEEDAKLLRKEKTDYLYLPSVEDIYPDGAKATVSVPLNISGMLCGRHRMGHFDGVATVVKRLFEITQPDLAVFGEKDFQQLAVIRWLVKEYAIPVEIIPAPIVRESDGLARSSRNRYLKEQERQKASMLFKAITTVSEECHLGKEAGAVCAEAFAALSKEGFKMDYLEVRDEETLELLEGRIKNPARVFIAASLGTTRLIDNVSV